MTPHTLTFREWVPDGPSVFFTRIDPQLPFFAQDDSGLQDVQNVIWRNGTYDNTPSFSAISTALPAASLGAFTAIDQTGAPNVYAATANNIYRWNGTAWVSLGSGYTASSWNFAQFNGCVVATNGVQPIQFATAGNNAFAQLSTAAPIASTLGVINDFLIAGNLQGFPNRIQWSAIGDEANWPTPLTDQALAFQAGYQDLPGEFGPVQRISGSQQYGVIFQRLGLTRATYIGGDVVFQFIPFDLKRGLITPNAFVQIGFKVFYLSDAGFYVTDGSQVQPIGEARVDGWFWNNVNPAALSAISAGYDSKMRNVFFAIPTGTNTAPDTLLSYNVDENKWGKSAISSQRIFTDNDGSRHFLGIVNTGGIYGRLNGAGLSATIESYDMGFLDSDSRLFVGASPNSGGSPSLQVGVRKQLSDPIVWSPQIAPDSETRIARFLQKGKFARFRIVGTSLAPVSGLTVFANTMGRF